MATTHTKLIAAALITAALVLLPTTAVVWHYATRSTSPAAPTQPLEDPYAFPTHQAIRWVQHPSESARLAFMGTQTANLREEYDKHPFRTMFIGWHDGQQTFDAWWGDQATCADLASILLHLQPFEVEGDPELLSLPFEGDLVRDNSASESQLLPDLAKILSQRAGLPVSLRFAQVDRPITILRGTWHYTPLNPAQTNPNVLEIFNGDTLNPTPASEFSQAISGTDLQSHLIEILQRRIEIQATGGSIPDKLTLHFTHNAQGGLDFRDPQILPRLLTQTGLTQSTESRPQRRLFIEKPPTSQPSPVK